MILRCAALLAVAALAACAPQVAPAPVVSTPAPAPAPRVASPPSIPAPNPAAEGPNDDWVQTGENGNSYVFVHVPTAKRTGQRVRAWTLYNRTAAVDGRRSIRALNEFDCARRSSRTLAVSSYTGVNSTGTQVGSAPFTETDRFEPAPPGTLIEGSLEVLCAVIK